MCKNERLFAFVAECSADGCAEFGVFGDMETHSVEVFNHLKNDATLWNLSKVADGHDVLDAAIESA